jgi:hypothetical protein
MVGFRAGLIPTAAANERLSVLAPQSDSLTLVNRSGYSAWTNQNETVAALFEARRRWCKDRTGWCKRDYREMRMTAGKQACRARKPPRSKKRGKPPREPNNGPREPTVGELVERDRPKPGPLVTIKRRRTLEK